MQEFIKINVLQPLFFLISIIYIVVLYRGPTCYQCTELLMPLSSHIWSHFIKFWYHHNNCTKIILAVCSIRTIKRSCQIYQKPEIYDNLGAVPQSDANVLIVAFLRPTSCNSHVNEINFGIVIEFIMMTEQIC
jgi:hypothetical protein